MSIVTTALSNGFVHIAIAGGGRKYETVRVICTRPDNGTQMIFALGAEEVQMLIDALRDRMPEVDR